MSGDFESDDFVDLSDSDWGNSLDDSDGSSWEYYFDCQLENDDDSDFDDDLENYESDDHEVAAREDWEEIVRQQEDFKKNKHIYRAIQVHEAFTTDRRIAIIKWVYQLDFSSPLKENKGFFIDAGYILNLYNGKSI